MDEALASGGADDDTNYEDEVFADMSPAISPPASDGEANDASNPVTAGVQIIQQCANMIMIPSVIGCGHLLVTGRSSKASAHSSSEFGSPTAAEKSSAQAKGGRKRGRELVRTPPRSKKAKLFSPSSGPILRSGRQVRRHVERSRASSARRKAEAPPVVSEQLHTIAETSEGKITGQSSSKNAGPSCDNGMTSEEETPARRGKGPMPSASEYKPSIYDSPEAAHDTSGSIGQKASRWFKSLASGIRGGSSWRKTFLEKHQQLSEPEDMIALPNKFPLILSPIQLVRVYGDSAVKDGLSRIDLKAGFEVEQKYRNEVIAFAMPRGAKVGDVVELRGDMCKIIGNEPTPKNVRKRVTIPLDKYTEICAEGKALASQFDALAGTRVACVGDGWCWAYALANVCGLEMEGSSPHCKRKATPKDKVTVNALLRLLKVRQTHRK